ERGGDTEGQAAPQRGRTAGGAANGLAPGAARRRVADFAEGGADAQAQVGRHLAGGEAGADEGLQAAFLGERRTASGAAADMIVGGAAVTADEFVVGVGGEKALAIFAAGHG